MVRTFRNKNGLLDTDVYLYLIGLFEKGGLNLEQPVCSVPLSLSLLVAGGFFREFCAGVAICPRALGSFNFPVFIT